MYVIPFTENACTAHTFMETVADIPITFHIIKMNSSLFVWIGDKYTFDNLAVAVNTKYKSLPISTSIMGDIGDDKSCSLASKLTKVTGKQVFASFNLSNCDNNVLLSVNKRLMEEFSKRPGMF